MEFPFSAYLCALVAAFACSCGSLPLWRAWCARTGLVDDPGHRKIHSEPIPLAGGLAVLTGLSMPLLIAGCCLLWNGRHQGVWDPWRYGWDQRHLQVAAILAGGLLMLLVGLLDDRFELSPTVKLIGQAVAASIAAGAGIQIKAFVFSGVGSFLVTVIWILALTNALNFLDNMNGLCAGLGVLASAFFGLHAATHGHYLVASMEFLTAGALLGFLPHNFPTARAFLGDAGSHLTGYLLAIMAVLPHFYTGSTESKLSAFRPLLILAVPIFDLLSVIVIRWRLGQPVYVGDNNHISHRLTRKGLSRTRAVLVIWLAAAICGFLGAL
jgi:UDP-GlcNAc:undecaprenyl-phosphate GlcNAc-1-phosphate transferase